MAAELDDDWSSAESDSSTHETDASADNDNHSEFVSVRSEADDDEADSAASVVAEGRWRVLALTCTIVVLSLSTWFAGTACEWRECGRIVVCGL